jgi:hypothetical protein
MPPRAGRKAQATQHFEAPASKWPVYLSMQSIYRNQLSRQSFSAASVSTGSAGNTPSEIFTRHNFTNYTQSSFGGLLVTNTYGIIGGRDREDDESYRYRIHLRLTAQSGINEAALRYQMLQLPGIQDVVFETSAGSFSVYLYAVSPVVPPSLLQLAGTLLTDTVAFPIQANVLTPDLVGISLATRP